MTARRVLKRYRIVLALIALDVILAAVYPGVGVRLFANTLGNFAEMLSVLPPVFLLLGLLDVWVPKQTVMRYLGEGSSALGVFLSIFLGAAAAGPLYGAFPVAEVMYRKGVSYFNILVFLGAWSTLKIPMFLFETSALGVRFSLTRWVVNLFVILIVATIINRVVPAAEKRVTSPDTSPGEANQPA